MDQPKLYMTTMSGNSFKVRVLASILGVELEEIHIDWDGREHKSPAFRERNPRGQVPVMEIAGRTYWDSTAHLVYLARTYGGEEWLPTNPLDMAEVMQWMAFAQNEVQFGLMWARGVTIYNRRPEAMRGYLDDSRTALEVLTWQLRKTGDWLALGRPTLAEISCYPYVKRGPQGQVPLETWPEVRAWLTRCEEIPGWFHLEDQP